MLTEEINRQAIAFLLTLSTSISRIGCLVGCRIRRIGCSRLIRDSRRGQFGRVGQGLVSRIGLVWVSRITLVLIGRITLILVGRITLILVGRITLILVGRITLILVGRITLILVGRITLVRVSRITLVLVSRIILVRVSRIGLVRISRIGLVRVSPIGQDGRRGRLVLVSQIGPICGTGRFGTAFGGFENLIPGHGCCCTYAKIYREILHHRRLLTRDGVGGRGGSRGGPRNLGEVRSRGWSGRRDVMCFWLRLQKFK